MTESNNVVSSQWVSPDDRPSLEADVDRRSLGHNDRRYPTPFREAFPSHGGCQTAPSMPLFPLSPLNSTNPLYSASTMSLSSCGSRPPRDVQLVRISSYHPLHPRFLHPLPSFRLTCSSVAALLDLHGIPAPSSQTSLACAAAAKGLRVGSDLS